VLDLESVNYCFDHSLLILLGLGCITFFGAKHLFRSIVGGDDENVMLDIDCGALDFSCDSISVCPTLDVMTKGLSSKVVEIIEQDDFLPHVTIPPFRLRFPKRLLIVLGSCELYGKVGLACSWRTVDP